MLPGILSPQLHLVAPLTSSTTFQRHWPSQMCQTCPRPGEHAPAVPSAGNALPWPLHGWLLFCCSNMSLAIISSEMQRKHLPYCWHPITVTSPNSTSLQNAHHHLRLSFVSLFYPPPLSIRAEICVPWLCTVSSGLKQAWNRVTAQ